MIEYRRGDLLAQRTEAIVNAVNCVGVMGRGIAAQCKRRWPTHFAIYARACREGRMKPGTTLWIETGEDRPGWIVCLPTKRHWREASRLEDIERGLADLGQQIEKRKIGSITLPAVGCGLGGLSWEMVRPMIEASLKALPGTSVVVMLPQGATGS